MIRILCIAVVVLYIPAAMAQTYLGDGNSTSGIGGSCCNWVATIDASNQACPASQLAIHPTCTTISLGQYTTYLTAASNLYGNKYPRVLAQGVAITCTCSGYPYGSLDGTYSLSGDDFDNRNLAYLNIKAGGSFPLGQSVVQFADTAGTLHTFDATHLLELGSAIQNYLATISAQYVNASGWPANNQATIP